MQGFIILAIIGTEKLTVTEVDGWTEIRNPLLHPSISRCVKKWRVNGGSIPVCTERKTTGQCLFNSAEQETYPAHKC